jgi:hypothetical protein|tara:strand:+ start:384 stop:803 length:420 start_codon:yes stop_codon:yes gene_type:complete
MFVVNYYVIYSFMYSKNSMMFSILKEFWLGNLTLSRSYWFFGNILPSIFLAIIFLIISSFHEQPLEAFITNQFLPTAIMGKIVVVSLCLLFFVYIFISIIAIWRSANRYEGRKLWKILAKVAIIISGFAYLKDFLKYLS